VGYLKMDVLIAAYSSPLAARRDYEALARLRNDGVIQESKGIVLVTSDEDANVAAEETGGGIKGKLVGRSVKRSLRGQLPADSGSVVAVFDAMARDEVDKVVTHHVRKAYAPVEGDGDQALDAALDAAEQELAGDSHPGAH
jgi:hypothetical protein